MSCTVVLPTFNEAGNIGMMIENLRKFGGPELQIIVVDDRSPDGTADKAEQLSAADPHLTVIRHSPPAGLSPSVIAGFDAAQTDWLCCMDADGQHRAEDFQRMIRFAEAENPDFIIGSRHVPGGGFTEKWNFFRVLCSSTAALAARILLGIKVHDPMSGFFMIKRSRYQQIRPQADPSGFKIMLELLTLTVPAPHAVIVEYPITFAMRKYGKSKLGAKVIFQYLAMLIRCFFRKRRFKNGKMKI